MTSHAVSSTRKPKNLLKSFLTATAAVWYFTSDDSECKNVALSGQSCEANSQATNQESVEGREKLPKKARANFLGRPLASFKSDTTPASLISYYRPSKRLTVPKTGNGHPLRISGSVYSREFHELEKLGSGGFGSVFRSQNLLDGNTYAIKKIFLPLSSSKRQQLSLNSASSTIDPFLLSDDIRISLREPQVMAAVCKHRNIVQYHHSWLEILPNWQNSEETHLAFPSHGTPLTYDDPSPDQATWTDGYGSEEDNGDQEASKIDFSSPSSPSSSSSASSLPSPSYPSSASASPTTDYSLVLFIQMELCEGASLYDWMRLPGRVLDPAENMRLFRQLIRGLTHLHAKNYCHRDVKPANLLIIPKGGRNTLKVGDFGCCKRMNHSDYEASSEMVHEEEQRSGASIAFPNASSPLNDHHEHTQGCGTFFYMAPELHTNRYDTSVDIFAAGIVLFELFHVFSTEMERFELLTLLHEKRLVTHAFIQAYPLEATLVLKMTHADPAMRPTAFDLLNDPRYGLCPVQDLDNMLSN